MTDWSKRFEGGVGEMAPDLLQNLVNSTPLERIGPYRLQSEIGRGGMGIVYRAQRNDGQFDQQVAIKLLPNAAPSADDLRRFERERQILANLNHPNIAKLYDGGVAEDGRLYLVMELVDGMTLTDFLETNHLNQDARLTLFEQVVAAVAHAQQQLIVHCDLKPSNILVTDQSEVRLLDFGVARVLEQSLMSDTRFPTDAQATATFDYQPLTPNYAAPEHLDAQPLGMYTDVYQLGLILYRLLCGEDFRETNSVTPVELANEIQQADQQRIEALRSSLDSDLLAVLLKTTARETRSRYSSAALLLEDIRRYRSGFAVSAHLPSRWHRLKKWARRRPATAIAIATLSAASLAFVVLLTVQERRVSAQRAIAVAQAQSAESVIEYLESILDANVTDRGEQGQKTTVYEMLLSSEANLPSQFKEQPIVRERLHRQHATSFYLVQDHDRAISNAKAAIAAFAVAPEGSIAEAALAESHYILGMAQVTLGNFQTGLANHTKAIAIVQASVNPDPEYLAELQIELGTHYLMGQRNATLALKHINAAVPVFAGLLATQPDAESHQDYAYVLRRRAVAYLMNQKYSLALADFNAGIEVLERQWGPIGVTDTMVREKGRALALLGQTDAALKILEAAYVDITTNARSNLHASISMLYGQAQMLDGAYPQAVELLEAALAGWIEHYGTNMAAVPNTQYLLALAKVGAGDSEGARKEATSALALGIAQHGEADPRTADYLVLVGDLANNPAEALSLYQRAKEIRTNLSPTNDWRNTEIEALLLLANLEANLEANLAATLSGTPGAAKRVDDQKFRELLDPLHQHEGIVPRQRAAQLQQRLDRLVR